MDNKARCEYYIGSLNNLNQIEKDKVNINTIYELTQNNNIIKIYIEPLCKILKKYKYDTKLFFIKYGDISY